jgi:hypothetical protein
MLRIVVRFASSEHGLNAGGDAQKRDLAATIVDVNFRNDREQYRTPCTNRVLGIPQILLRVG